MDKGKIENSQGLAPERQLRAPALNRFSQFRNGQSFLKPALYIVERPQPYSAIAPLGYQKWEPCQFLNSGYFPYGNILEKSIPSLPFTTIYFCTFRHWPNLLDPKGVQLHNRTHQLIRTLQMSNMFDVGPKKIMKRAIDLAFQVVRLARGRRYPHL